MLGQNLLSPVPDVLVTKDEVKFIFGRSFFSLAVSQVKLQRNDLLLHLVKLCISLALFA